MSAAHELPPSALATSQVSFRYASGRAGETSGATWAIRDLTCQIHEGTVFGIIGPNGSGKSSLLKLLARVVEPFTGSITLFGADLGRIRQDAIARAVALVPQETYQVFSFTIAEMVLMGRYPHHRPGWNLGGLGWETDDDVRLAEAAMGDMEVSHLAARSISDVSGGERQRAIIARALAQQPSVLLLDEPTAFLDLHHQVEICRILRRLNEERGLTVVLVSHDLNLASQYCDRLMLLQEGQPFRIGTPEEVIRPDLLQTVYGCRVFIDPHPVSGLPRVTLPGREPAPPR